MISKAQVVALLRIEPGIRAVEADAEEDVVYFYHAISPRRDDESYEEFLARLSEENKERVQFGYGMSFETYSLLVDVGCSVFQNDCQGFEDEYMVNLPARSNEE